MIIPDVNLLVYAYDQSSASHLKAKTWWTACLSGDEAIGLPACVIFSFVRLTTNPRAFRDPFSAEEAIEIVRSWLEHPPVVIIEATYRDEVFRLLKEAGTAGNLVSDAQIAAIALQEEATLHTADTDFLRFRGLKSFDPLA